MQNNESDHTSKNDFSKGSIIGNILSLAIPMTLAQLINILYNIIDRMYIGRIPENAALSLTGLGLCMPITFIVHAFASLVGTGGAPLCSIARGNHDLEKASRIMNISFFMLLVVGGFLTVIGFLFKQPLLYLFGASDATYVFANEYLSVYLIGTVFSIISMGMNGYINSQGFGKMGMLTVLIGAVLNIALDPLFIFVMDMGIQGAAIATVISQFASAFWTILFLTGKKTILRLEPSHMQFDKRIAKDIMAMGLTGFIMAFNTSAVQIVCNATLANYGGDVYVGVMTIINSIREVITTPINGLTSGAQPVIGFNYGAKCYGRVKTAITFMSAVCILYTLVAWGILHLFPVFFITLFSHETELIIPAVPALRIYFSGFIFMALQFAAQGAFMGLGKARYAIFFSLLRKAIIVIPITLILPLFITPPVNGVFWSEPISNLIGGLASFLTMVCVVGKEIRKNIAE